MAFGVGVDDVVVDEREVVDQLDGHAARAPRPRGRPRPPRRPGWPGWAGCPCRPESRPGCPRRRSSPCGRWPAAGSRAPGVRWPRSGPGRWPGGSGPGLRGRQWSGSRHLLGVVGDCDESARRVVEAGRPPRPGRCAPRLPWSPATRCRSTPRPPPGRARRCAGPGRRPAVPGRARKVALRSLVTRESTTRARPVSGRSRASSAVIQSTRSSGRRPSRSSAAETDTARYCGPVRTAGHPRPDDAVRSKTHWTGERTPASSGQRRHRPVEDQMHVDDGRGAQLAEPVLVGRPSPAAAWRRRHRGERRTMTASAVEGSVVRCGPRSPRGAASAVRCGSTALPPGSPGAPRRRPAPGRRRPARRAAGRAAPGSNRCRRRPVSVSSPVWNTLAAMASDASAAGRLTVGTVIRSHRPATASGDWPCRASQAPKRLLVQGRVVAGPGARNASTARPRPSRSLGRQVRDNAAGSRRGAAGRAGPSGAGGRPAGGPPGAAAGATTGMSRRSGSSTSPLAPIRSRNDR